MPYSRRLRIWRFKQLFESPFLNPTAQVLRVRRPGFLAGDLKRVFMMPCDTKRYSE
jgi:hypothetical protein